MLILIDLRFLSCPTTTAPSAEAAEHRSLAHAGRGGDGVHRQVFGALVLDQRGGGLRRLIGRPTTSLAAAVADALS